MEISFLFTSVGTARLMSLNGNCDSINYVQSLLMGLVFVTFSLEGDSLCSVAALIFAPRRDSKDSNDLKKCWRKCSDQNHSSFWFFNNFGPCFCILCYTSGHGWEAATPLGGWMDDGWMDEWIMYSDEPVFLCCCSCLRCRWSRITWCVRG